MGTLLRFVNTTILTLVILLTLTGLYGIVWVSSGWIFDVHRIAGWALIVLIPWKAGISWRSLKRGLQPRFDRSVLIVVSLLLALTVLAIMGLGLVWAWNVGPWVLALGQTAISWHWTLALVIVAPFALHAWRRWPRPKRTDFTSRRAVLRMLALGGVGVAGWTLAEWLAQARADEAQPRAPTGSRERESFSGNDLPVTHSAGEGRVRLEPESWTLGVGGAVERPFSLTYDELLSLPAAEVKATLDCTTGWYSTQVWRGVWLTDVLERAGVESEAEVVRLVAVSGYLADYTLVEAEEILLATHVGGEVLNHWHGYPLRAVVPSRRGWLWVKWLTGLEVLTGPRAAAPDTTAPRVFTASPSSQPRVG